MQSRAADRYTLNENGCHISTYSAGNHGYAQIGWGVNGKTFTVLAHQAAWIKSRGLIPDGMTIDHHCPVRNRKCINVEHLRLLTNFENARRTSGRDWPLGQCVNGHSNEHLGPVNGGRQTKCMICRHDAQRRYRIKRGLAKT